ncbi:MAG: hypothetical protein ACYSTS_18085 [Planctomycetota bacterium]|jgi:hypothetical protein
MPSQMITVYKWNGKKYLYPVTIYEHSKSTREKSLDFGFRGTGQKVRTHQTMWSCNREIYLSAAGKYPHTIEYRFPHYMKSEFYKEFKPAVAVRGKPINTTFVNTGGGRVFLTYSKLDVNQGKIYSTSSFSNQLDSGLLNAAATAARTAPEW